MSRRKVIIISLTVILASIVAVLFFVRKSFNPNPAYKIGDKLDSLNGVYVYYNGGVSNVEDRNRTADGYNLGLRYQCVEFVKRYYYEHYHHKMPDAYGNARDFFDSKVKDGSLNEIRDLVQFTNPSFGIPKIGDLVIMDGHSGNPYGHVAIISNVSETEVEIIQQNPGPFAPSRVNLDLVNDNDSWTINHPRLLGWLRMK